MTFNPAARRGDPDWRVMYVGVGDSGTGEQRDIRRLNPQRLDNSRRQDPPHRPGPARAHGDDHRQRQRPLPHPQ